MAVVGGNRARAALRSIIWSTDELGIKGTWSFSSPIALTAFVGALAVAWVVPASSNGATLVQVRRQLFAWHLRPAPLFRSQLPPSFHGASVTLYRFSGVDFDVELAKPDWPPSSPSTGCIYAKALTAGRDHDAHRGKGKEARVGAGAEADHSPASDVTAAGFDDGGAAVGRGEETLGTADTR